MRLGVQVPICLPKSGAIVVATHTQQRKNAGHTEYRVMSCEVANLGTTLFWLEGAQRKPNNHGNPPGPQNYMKVDAENKQHTMWVAFDVVTNNGSSARDFGSTKAFASYRDDRALYDALFTSNVQHRLLPRHMLNSSYEIVRENIACWPHFDIEWDPKIHSVNKASDLVLFFMDLVLASLRRHYPFKCSALTRQHFRVSRSRNASQKCSYHLVLRGGVAFADSATHHHAFMQMLFRELVLAMVLDKHDVMRPLFFNRAQAKVKVGGGCIMDTQIYTRNREFRVCGAVKLSAPDRVLVAYDLEHDCELEAPETMSYERWREYLVGNVPSPLSDDDDDDALSDMQLLSATPDMLALAKGKTPPVSINSVEQEALLCYFNALAGVPTPRSTTDEQLRANTIRQAPSAKRTMTASQEEEAATAAAVAPPPPPAPKRQATNEAMISSASTSFHSDVDSNSSTSSLSESMRGRFQALRNAMLNTSASNSQSHLDCILNE